MSFGLGRAVPANMDASTPWMAAADGNLALVQESCRQAQLHPATAADENGYTLLHAAASYSRIALLEWLVQQPQNANVNAVDAEGDSALHYASTVEAAQFLVQQAHIDVSIRNHAQQTALQSKRAELEEMRQDEDFDEEDEDYGHLQAVVEYLSAVEAARNRVEQ